MEELQLALTAARVEQKNFGLWLKSWQVGQVLQALVTDKFPSGQLVLRVAGQQITATADIPVQKGAVLMLEVSSLTPTPTLKIINAPVTVGVPTSVPRGELQLLLPQFLPQQGRVLDPFLTLFSPSQGANILAFLGLKKADIARLFKQVHKADQLVDPKLLKAAVEKSGLFLESQLQQLVSVGGVLPPGDLKAELLRLLSRVNRKLKDSDGVDHETLGLLNKLKRELDGAIAKITLHQMEASQSDPDGQTVWSFEIPVRFKDSVAHLSVTVSRDNDPSNKQKPQDQQDWKAALSVTAPNLGLVEAELFLRGQKVSVVIFSSKSNVVQLINDQLDQLRVGLESRGLDVSVLLSREGELIKPKQNNPNSSSCVDERI